MLCVFIINDFTKASLLLLLSANLNQVNNWAALQIELILFLSFTPVWLSHLYNLRMFSSNKSSIVLSFGCLCLTILCPRSHLGVRMADWLCAYGNDSMGVVSARLR